MESNTILLIFSLLFIICLIIILCVGKIFYNQCRKQIIISKYVIHSNIKSFDAKKNKKSNKFNISVVMWYNKNIEDYAKYTFQINKRYCELNNYDLIHSDKVYFQNRHPSWECIKLVYDTLNNHNYEYVIWIDADAIFNLENNNKNLLNDVIESYSDKDIIFSDDNMSSCIINCGFMIFKNTELSKKICNKIILGENCKSTFTKRIWEQSCLNKYYKMNIYNIQNNTVILPYGLLQIWGKDLITNKFGIRQLSNKKIFKNNNPLIIHLCTEKNKETY